MKGNQPNASKEQLTYVALAETSLLVTTLLIHQDIPELYFPNQALISKLIFAAICLIGIVAGLAPSWCSFSGNSDATAT